MRQASRIPASPLARRLAQENGVDIGALRGTGPDGRIVAADVMARRGIGASGPGDREVEMRSKGDASGVRPNSHYTLEVFMGPLDDMARQLGPGAHEAPDARATLLMMAAAVAAHSSSALEPPTLTLRRERLTRGPVAVSMLANWTEARRALAAEPTTRQAGLVVIDLGDTAIIEAAITAERALTMTIGRNDENATSRVTLCGCASSLTLDTALPLLHRFKAAIEAPARLLVASTLR